ncbi:scm-like with four MBT domains protein 1 [Centruroides sculpturatus]|uniref:scm-like with four MBT domains protein 1 n=2 Tax=Centruroides sculpturatus TaxID=218467 RepID=UPI000C6DEEBC|nr:scm-like with four MBT domains protein 1 [Centruroides sculpturatus]
MNSEFNNETDIMQFNFQDDELRNHSDSNNSDNVLEALSLTSSPQEDNNADDQIDGTRLSTEVSTSTDSTIDNDFTKKSGNEEEKELTLRKRKLTDSTAEEDEASDGNEVEFCWDDYLDISSSVAAPAITFVHVEHSLDNILKVGMKLEIPNSEPPESYWLATIIMTCGPLLTLRYFGIGEDRSKDFWYDVNNNEVHPPGWCVKNSMELFPPECKILLFNILKLLYPSYVSLIKKYNSSLQLQNGITPIEQIKQGMKVEIQEELDPNNVWIATIIENVGGRLLMRYDGVTSHDFWLFYLSHRLHLVGWGHDHGCQYQPPKELKHIYSDAEWTDILRISVEESEKVKFPSQVLAPQEVIETHSFKAGMKLEAVSPASKLQLCPATVTKVLNNYYFLVEIDDYRKDTDKKQSPAVICCHANSLVIFPVNWGKEHGVKIHFPKGLVDNPGNKEFDWQQYLNFCKAEVAPCELFKGKFINLGLEPGMKLEAVNPYQTNQICAATVTRVVDPLIWIQFDSIDIFHSNHILPMNSQDIFPVGWCESNGFSLKPPRTCLSKRQRKIMKRVGVLSDTSPKKSDLRDDNGIIQGTVDIKTSSTQKDNAKAWCPIIYFNHKCFSGPFLGKNRLAELPKHVGPGPVNLVMKEVLTMLINIAYKSSRVLSELELKGKSEAGMQEQILKAKYKGKTYRAAVEIVRRSDQVEEFCRKICNKLECCPYLFGPVYVGDDCPEKCHTQTKTQYIHSFTKKQKKVGRPPLLPKNEDGSKGPGRKRKKRRLWCLPSNNISPSLDGQTASNSGSETIAQKENCQEEIATSPSITSGEQAMKLKRKYQKFVAPKSAIVTRGAKIPNFGLNWRRQQESANHFVPIINNSKLGRPSKIRSINDETKLKDSPPVANNSSGIKIQNIAKTCQTPFQLHSNPLNWNVDDVVRFLKTTDCAPLARILKEQEVDGQAFLLLNLPIVQEFLELKPEPAIRLCRQIERVKLAFYRSFA